MQFLRPVGFFKRQRKGAPAGAPPDDGEAQRPATSGVVPSTEHPTTPAPASAVRESSRLATPRSSWRPTSIPSYDLEEMARAACLRPARTPLNASRVPVRASEATLPEDLPLRHAFLLLHADTRSTIAEIAASTQISPEETHAIFIELETLGLVELRGATA